MALGKQRQPKLDLDNIKTYDQLHTLLCNLRAVVNKWKALLEHVNIILTMLGQDKYNENGVLSRKFNLNSESFDKVSGEIDQCKEVYNYTPTQLIEIIRNKNIIKLVEYYKKYSKIYTIIRELEHKIDRFIRSLQLIKRRISEKIDVSKKKIAINNEFIIETLKKFNVNINAINGFLGDKLIPYAIDPNPHAPQQKHKRYITAAAAAGVDLTAEEYSEFTEDSPKINIHSSRRYNCDVHRNSIGVIIEGVLKKHDELFIRVSARGIELFGNCPCIKKGARCNTQINIDDLLKKNKLYEIYKMTIDEIKKKIFFELYGVVPYTNCPKPDCPNGNGFLRTGILEEIETTGRVSIQTPIEVCPECNTEWCSICNKYHPGRICEVEGEDKLDDSIKKCPDCKLLTMRDGGCFHMTCVKCSIHWCWTCNQQITQADPYAHKCITGIPL